jgi:DNA polymerase/3'-5' exonuclease PolX
MNNKKIIEELRGIADYLEKNKIDHLQQKTFRNAADLI